MVIYRDYIRDMVEAARSVLIEVVQALGEYREHIVLIGGWVPEFIIKRKNTPYIGSLDVDLALEQSRLKENDYKTIQDLLSGRGYEQGGQPFIFYRRFLKKNREVSVQVNLVSEEYDRTDSIQRDQGIKGPLAKKARGCDLAFEDFIEVRIEGEMPGGEKAPVIIRVASIATFLVMKGMALSDRLKEKDAWDIYYCVKNYSDDIDDLVEIFMPYKENNLVREGLEEIERHFVSEVHTGPRLVADFEEVTDAEERALMQRDAYERVNYLLEKLGIR